MSKRIFTIGHSNRTSKKFLEILKSFQINLLVDVRHYPGSKYCPQFGKKRLETSLARAGIQYLHLVGLGGRRPPVKEMKKNMAWRNPQFRGYADYMQTKEFKENLKELVSLSKENVVAIMCAEAVPWRCHRSMIGDALLVRGFDVEDIFDVSKDRPHRLTSFAKVHRNQITYPVKNGSAPQLKSTQARTIRSNLKTSRAIEDEEDNQGQHRIKIKRVYEKPAEEDGYRIFVDRLWPRGKKKKEVPFDEWPKQISPSPGLCRSSRKIRKQFGYNPKRWKEFRSEYLRELRKPEAKQKLELIFNIAKRRNLTLLYSTNDEEHNNAAVLRQLIMRKVRQFAKKMHRGDHRNETRI